MQQPDEIYREKLNSFWGNVAFVLFFGVSLLFIALFFYQRAYGPLGDRPAPNWFYIMMSCIFLALGWLMSNFRSLTLIATNSSFTVGYGRFRYRMAWENIVSCELDKGPGLRNYGGYGIRFGRRNGKSVLVYNTMGSPVVLVEVKSGNYAYFGFSTKRADQVMELINKHKR